MIRLSSSICAALSAFLPVAYVSKQQRSRGMTTDLWRAKVVPF